MSGSLPERLEAGTLGTPAICGLCAGIGYVSKIGIGEIFERDTMLINRLTENPCRRQRCDALRNY